MAYKCIAMLATVSIQAYVFRSNRLREAVGASYLVKYCMGMGLDEFLEKKYKFERIPCGGGNAALLFEEEETARKAVYEWSRSLLEDAPGLRVAAGFTKYEEGKLSDAYLVALKNLERSENGPPFGFPLMALPVVRNCNSTGFPAVVKLKDEDTGFENFFSIEADKKRKAVGRENEKGPAIEIVERDFKDILDNGEKQFPLKLEDLGGKSGEAHIAVVHIDGNDIGSKRRSIVKKSYTSDDAFKKTLSSFSKRISDITLNSLEKALSQLKDSLPDLKDELRLVDDIFPFRPIIYGGDDLTFVCDGRIGLSLAAYCLKAFEDEAKTAFSDEKAPTACAGVAIVPTKYPFARAVRLADELCSQAKKVRLEKRSSGSYLDFQILHSGSDVSLGSLRDRRYRSATGKNLLERPLSMDRDWIDFERSIQHFKEEWPHSAAHKMLQLYSEDSYEMDRFLSTIKSRGLSLPGHESEAWCGDKAKYFDALESLDYFLPIKRGNHEPVS